MTRPGPFFLALEERLRRVAEFPRVPARAAGKTLSFEVGVESYIGRPHADPDERAVVISFGHAGRPVQQGGAQPESGVASADDYSSYVQHRPPVFFCRPDGTLFCVQGFISVDRDGRGGGLTVSYQPRLAFEQVVQYALSMSGAVRPGLLPLINALAP